MISIIIPCQKPSEYLKECLEHISKLDYADFEAIVLPDENVETRHRSLSSGQTRLVSTDIDSAHIKIIPTGTVLPGKKRNIGAREAKGEILAFIDDDAYPARDWLKNATKYFEDKNVIAIGGSGLTPPNDSFWQLVSGAMYLSWFSGANPDRFSSNYPNSPNHPKKITDWPSMNFFVHRDSFLATCGFDENFWPGEDTLLCQKLLSLKKPDLPNLLNFPNSLILYTPDVIVFHHRRKNLKQHLIQAGQFGFMRGLFASLKTSERSRDPEFAKGPTSQKSLKYFLPTLFTLFILFGWLLLFLPHPWNLSYPALFTLYSLSLSISLIQIYAKIKKIKVVLASLIYIPLTHFWYGWKFLQGIFAKNPKHPKIPNL